MKHKVLSVLFATVFTAGMLAGCGSSDTASQKQEMTLEEESTEGQTAVDDETAAKAVSEEETVRKRNLMMVQIKLPQQELQ